MGLKSDAVGLTVETPPWHLSARRALAFASAIAPDEGGLFADDSEAFGVLPMAIVTPEWRAALQLRAGSELGLTEAEQLRAVHAGQDTRFHAPLRVGASLVTRATVSGARATPSGALLQIHYETRDAETGSLFADTVSHSIYRGVDIDGVATLAAGAKDEPDLPPDQSRELSLADGFAHLYSEAADIWNPIHTERRVAIAAGLPGCIVHGTALWALAGFALAKAQGVSPLRIARLSCRFTGIVLAGADIVVRFGANKGRASFGVYSAGAACLTRGVVEFCD